MSRFRSALLASVCLPACLLAASATIAADVEINSAGTTNITNGQTVSFGAGAGQTGIAHIGGFVVSGSISGSMGNDAGIVRFSGANAAVNGDVSHVYAIESTGNNSTVRGKVDTARLRLMAGGNDISVLGNATNVSVDFNGNDGIFLFAGGQNTLSLAPSAIDNIGTLMFMAGSNTTFTSDVGSATARLKTIDFRGQSATFSGLYARNLVLGGDATITVETLGADVSGADGQGRIIFSGTGPLTIDSKIGTSFASLAEIDITQPGSSGVTIASDVYAKKLNVGLNHYLTIGNGGTDGMFHGELIVDGTATYDRSDEQEFGASLSGTGVFVKKGQGALTLGGTNSIDKIEVLDGRLIGDADSLNSNIEIAGNGELIFNQVGNGTYNKYIYAQSSAHFGAATKTGAGTLTFTGNSDVDWHLTEGRFVLATSPNSTFNGDFSLGLNGELEFADLGSQSLSYDGAINGVGTVFFNGDTKLSGDSHGFNGTGKIAGSLFVTGKLGGSHDVLSGGHLTGAGTVSNIHVYGGGSVSASKPSATLQTTGIVFEPGSMFAVNVRADGTAGDIQSGFTTIKDGAAVRIIPTAGTYVDGTKYTILTSSHQINGGFSSVLASSASNLAFLTPELSQDDYKVYVTLTKGNGSVNPGNGGLFETGGRTANQRSVANAAEKLGAGNPIYNAIMVQTNDDAAGALQTLTGEQHSTETNLMLSTSSYMRSSALGRVNTAMSNSVLSDLDVGQPVDEVAVTDSASVWMSAYGSRAFLQADGGDSDGYAGGLQLGADDWFGDVRLGMMLDVGAGSLRSADGSSTTDSRNYGLGVYGGTDLGGINILAGASYERLTFESERNVVFPGFNETLTADYAGSRMQGFAEVNYDFDIAGGTVTPYGQVAVVRTQIDGFTEAGGAAALSVASTSDTAVFTTIGVRGETSFVLGDDFIVKAGAGLGWRHSFAEASSSTHAFASGGDTFTVAGAPVAKDAFMLEAGLATKITPATDLQLNYAGQLAGKAQDHSVSAALKFHF